MSITLARSVTCDLLDLNAGLLQQALDVLAMDSGTYTRPAELFDNQRIGGHIRHVVEFYERLFAGLRTGVVDYAARRRDPVVESDREAAIARLTEIHDRLQTDNETFDGVDLLVQPEESSLGPVGSTAARELEAVASHTVHHFALVAVLLRYFGHPVPDDFGVSKTTLRHRELPAAPAVSIP